MHHHKNLKRGLKTIGLSTGTETKAGRTEKKIVRKKKPLQT